MSIIYSVSSLVYSSDGLINSAIGVKTNRTYNNKVHNITM